MVDIKVHKLRCILPKPFQEVTISSHKTPSMEEDEGKEIASVKSDLEKEVEGGNLPNNAYEFLYLD
jgi:hypothetical protein